MIVLIDNYDSFTYNLFQVLSVLGATVQVFRHDAVTPAEVRALRPEGIVISPGPGDPAEAGVSCEILQECGGEIPILGVCLGHQCIGAAFGGHVVPAADLMHGKTSLIYHRGEGVFADLPSPFEAVRYHSLTVERETLPPELQVTAETVDGTIMGLRHRNVPIEGVQFHPESVLTKEGPHLLRNFLRQCGTPEWPTPLDPMATRSREEEAAHRA